LKPKVKVRRVKIPSDVLIAGKLWKLSPFPSKKSTTGKNTDGDEVYGKTYFKLWGSPTLQSSTRKSC